MGLVASNSPKGWLGFTQRMAGTDGCPVMLVHCLGQAVPPIAPAVVLGLVMMDFALTNVELHCFLANPQDKTKDNSRYDWRDGLAEAMHKHDWATVRPSHPLGELLATSPMVKAPASEERSIPRVNKGFHSAPSMDMVDLTEDDGDGLSPLKPKTDCHPTKSSAHHKKRNEDQKGSAVILIVQSGIGMCMLALQCVCVWLSKVC